MSVERAAHAATLLPDGRVLVTGGIRTGEVGLDSAEFHDPETSQFTPAGTMTSVRNSHAAVGLPDGRVLVIGGAK